MKEVITMKETYSTPSVGIIEFETEDVITTSGNTTPFEPCSTNW